MTAHGLAGFARQASQMRRRKKPMVQSMPMGGKSGNVFTPYARHRLCSAMSRRSTPVRCGCFKIISGLEMILVRNLVRAAEWAFFEVSSGRDPNDLKPADTRPVLGGIFWSEAWPPSVRGPAERGQERRGGISLRSSVSGCRSSAVPPVDPGWALGGYPGDAEPTRGSQKHLRC